MGAFRLSGRSPFLFSERQGDTGSRADMQLACPEGNLKTSRPHLFANGGIDRISCEAPLR
jgi:hypothetical protein